MPNKDGMTTPIVGKPGSADWEQLGPGILKALAHFLPALRKEIDALPVGTRATLINRYDELGAAYETWCQQAGVDTGAGFATTAKAGSFS